MAATTTRKKSTPKPKNPSPLGEGPLYHHTLADLQRRNLTKDNLEFVYNDARSLLNQLCLAFATAYPTTALTGYGEEAAKAGVDLCLTLTLHVDLLYDAAQLWFARAEVKGKEI